MRKKGWYAVIGGPHDGSEYFAPSEPKPHQGVRLGLDKRAPIVYRFNESCTFLEYIPDVEG